MPDWTVIVQLGIFLFALFIINSFILKPVLRSTNLRRAYTDGALKEASILESKADKLDNSRQETLKMEIADAQRVRLESVGTAEIAAASILRFARRDVKKVLESSSAAIASDEFSALKDMESMSDEISDEIVAKLAKTFSENMEGSS